jgi:hypothetical protein
MASSTERVEPVLQLLPAMVGGGIEWRGRERGQVARSVGQVSRAIKSTLFPSHPIPSLAVPLREQEQAATDSGRINYDSRRMPQPCDVLAPRKDGRVLLLR